MSDAAAASTYSHATTDKTNTPEPVYVLPWNAKGLAWPAVHKQDLILVIGLFWFLFLFAYFLGRFVPYLHWLSLVTAVGIALFALRVGIRKFRALRNERPYSGPLPSGEAGRLRVLAPTDKMSAALADFTDIPFEPIILRCIQDVSFGELDENGSPKLDRPKGVNDPYRQLAQTTTYTNRALSLTSLGSIILGIAAVIVLQRVGMGRWWIGLHPELISLWSGIALGTLIAAFAKPSYLRISPGALDVLIYPPLGLGRPHCERYDLRIGSITIDEKGGRIRVSDPSRTHRQILFLRRRWVLTRNNLPALLLNAARSTHPTPPLPTDALLG